MQLGSFIISPYANFAPCVALSRRLYVQSVENQTIPMVIMAAAFAVSTLRRMVLPLLQSCYSVRQQKWLMRLVRQLSTERDLSICLI
jgi:hypothetical protein